MSKIVSTTASAGVTDVHNNRSNTVVTILMIILQAMLPVALLLFALHTQMKAAWILFGISALIIGAVIWWSAARQKQDWQERDNLRVSEEAYRIAAAHGNLHVCRYDVKSRTLIIPEKDAETLGCASVSEIMPDSMIGEGRVSPESEQPFRRLFEEMNCGRGEGTCTASLAFTPGRFIWYDVSFTMLYDRGAPICAILCLEDISERRERELAYEKWRQSIEERPPETFVLYEHNITADRQERTEGALFGDFWTDPYEDFPTRIRHFAEAMVFREDAEAYLHFMDRDRMLASYLQGNRNDSLEFRVVSGGGDEPRWLRLTLQMVEYPGSSEIKGYFLYLDIHEEKRTQLELQARSEEDGLTKALNRKAFLEKAERLLAYESPEGQHAFLMIDLDNFKNVNDTLGHVVGDRTLTEVGTGIRFMLRSGDLFGRIGGDEFMICLKNIPYDAVIEKRARQLGSVVRRMLDGKLPISASLGIAVYPRDGETFTELYEHADAALYHTKMTGKDGYSFYKPGMAACAAPADAAFIPGGDEEDAAPRQALLLAGSDAALQDALTERFQDQYRILRADSATVAIAQMSRHGVAGIAAAVMDTRLPDMDIAEVLGRIRRNKGIASIPVILLGEDNGGNTAFQAMEAGATDYIALPSGPDVIRLHIQTVISRAQNDWLRIQNSYLLLQSEDEERYRNIIRSTGTIVMEYDWVNGVFVYDQMTGQSLWGVYDERPLWRILLADGTADTETVKAMQRFALQVANSHLMEQDHMDVSLKTAAGPAHWFRMHVVRMRESQLLTGKLLITFNDVDDEVRTMERLRELAELDGLTGLLNRNTFMARAEALIRSHPPGAYVLLYFDIDKFKTINDRLGHGAGDSLLRAVADSIRKNTGEGCLGCRISADFFAVCMPYQVDWLRRIQAVYQKELQEMAFPFEVTLSFGLCIVDDPDVPVDALLDRAAIAHHSIKGSYQRSFAYYDKAMREELLEKQAIEGQMRSALRQGQFQVYLQPQYHLASGSIIGAEALVRWVHPERGVLSPGRFIPLFEQNGFISEVDAFVWEEVCRLLRKWADEDMPFIPVSVNISREDLRDQTLPDRLAELTLKYKLPPGALSLEITESAYADSPAQLIDAVRELRAKGFSVEMDDFGSGYSSLNILKDVPVSGLKLDLRFLTGQDVSGRGGSIVNSVVRMAKWLNLPVIAEGVETALQAAYLKSIGCDNAQGFLFHQPMPIPAFEQLLSESSVMDASDRSLTYRMDIADANAFWNPNSLETLIFNSYVGGAAIIEFTPETGLLEILRANDKYLGMLRMSAETFSSLRFDPMGVMPERDRETYLATLRRAIDGGDEQVCITRRVLKGEEILWLRSRLRILAQSPGRCIFYVAIEDMTAEKNAQQTLRSSQAVLLAATNHTRLYYWTYDMEHDSSVQGALSQNNFGIPEYMENYPESLIATGFLHPDFEEVYRQLHRDLKAGKTEVSADIRSRWQDGYEWRRIKYSSVTDAQGRRTKAIGTSESLAAYKELEARFMTAAEQCGIITWVYDLRKKRVVQDLIQENGEKRTVQADNVPESTIADGIVHPEDEALFRGLYSRMEAGERSVTAVLRLRAEQTKDQTWFWYRMVYTVNQDKDGLGKIAIGTAVNINDQMNLRARYEQVQRQYEQLDKDTLISSTRANLTLGTMETTKGVRRYDEELDRFCSHIPDAAVRADILRRLSADALQAEYMAGRSRVEMDYRLCFPDGASRFVNTAAHLLVDPERHDLMAFLFTKDIHDRKMTDAMLRRIIRMDFDFVADVDLGRDACRVYSGDLSGSTAEILSTGGKYSEICNEMIEHEVLPPDRARCRLELMPARILARLQTEPRYQIRFRIRTEEGGNAEKVLQIFFVDADTKHVCLARVNAQDAEG